MTLRRLAIALLGLTTLQAAAADPEIRFNRDIRPILSDSCFLCHGPDKSNRKAKLRLDDRAVALAKGAIVSGDVAKSEVVRRLFTADPDDRMPPPDSGRKITPAQRELLKKWIAAGATYEPHWAYVPPVRPAVPATTDKQWPRNPIDAFILQALEAKNIKPSPEADRRTLLRRLSLDLVGLPPTPADVDAFVADQSPGAYEKQVRRLLASPHFGERMAAPWLDLARFADTVGYHGDQNQRIFPYRDYVIDAFNTNKPFDQFVTEQLAGDLLDNPTPSQLVATGFNRLNMMTREGGAQPKEYLAKYTADRVRTVSTTFLGSTMACCECHDHKFDPFSTRDFYALGAYFADVKQWGVYMDYGYTPNPDLKGFSNDHPFPPEIEVDSPYLQQRQTRLRKQIDDLAAAALAKLLTDPKQAAAFDAWRKSAAAFLKTSPTGWLTPPVAPHSAVVTKTTPPADAVINPDGSVLITAKVKKGDEQQLQLTLPAGPIAAIRLEVLPHAKNKGAITRGGAKSTTITLSATHHPKSAKGDTKLAFHHADADYKDLRYANGADLLGILGGWKTSTAHANSPQAATYLLDKPITAADGDKLLIAIKSDDIGCVRVSVSPFANNDTPDFPDSLSKSLAVSRTNDRPAVDATLPSTYLLGTAADPDAFAAYKPLRRQLAECRHGRAWTMITQSRGEPIPQRVLPRGNWQDESGEQVQPSPPHFLPPIRNPQSAIGNRQTRLDLAKWITSKENPLTARTFVNRLWKQFFGNALSAVVDDLGAQGEPPSHPDLLDYLAVEFQSDWDVKKVIERIVLSSTYRQSASLRPELRDLDPANRLLASQNPRRLEAEFVRDNALAVAGLLTLDLGGPSAHPYQPPGYYVNIQFPTRDYYPELDDRQYRRGLYTHWQRTFMHPMLANFDAPSREECTANRNLSNTPQQALTLLNDPTFVEAAKVFAANLLAPGTKSDDAARLDAAFQSALLRPIKPNERDSLTKFLALQRAYYTANPADARKLTATGQTPPPATIDPAELAAWTTVCRVVLNLHETITRY